MTLAAEHCSTDLRLEWNLIVLPAVVADDLVAFGCIDTIGRFLRTTLCATLRGHHVALVKDLLLFLGEKEGLFTLHARSFDVRHIFLLSRVTIG